MIAWFLSQFPWWAWAVLGLGVVLAVWRIFGLSAALAALGAVATIVGYRKGVSDGGAVELADQQKAQDQAVKDFQAVKHDVTGLTDKQVTGELQAWVKKP
jgi:hypothetical protein